MPATYELAPDIPDTVRVSDPDTGLSRLMYDPAKAREIRSQQAPAAGAPGQPWNGQAFNAGGDETPGPFDAPGAPSVLPQRPMGSPPPATDRPLAAAPSLLAPRGSMAIPGAPAAPAGTQLHKAELTPGVAGQPYDLDREEQRHEGLIDRKLAVQGQNDKVQAVLNDQQLQLQQQQLEDQQRQEEEGRKRLRFENELETVKRETGPMSGLGALGSVALGLVGLFMAKRSQNPGMALSRMNQSLDSAITKDIEIQRHDHDSTIARLTQQLGNAQQAELMYRGSVRRLALDRVKNNMTRLGEDANTDALMRAAEGEVQTIDDQAKAASFNKPGVAKYEFAQPKPVKGGAAGVAGSVAGSPAQETYVDQELTKWGNARGLKPQQAQEAWEKYTKAGVETAPVLEAIRGAEAAIAPYQKSGDVPGKGLFGDKLPDWWVGAEGNTVRQNVQNATSQFLRSVSGAAVQKEERSLLDRVAQGTGNFDDIQRGMEIIKRTVSATNSYYDQAFPAFARIRKESERLGSKQSADDDAGLAAQDRMANAKPAAKAAAAAPEDSGFTGANAKNVKAFTQSKRPNPLALRPESPKKQPAARDYTDLLGGD